MLSCKALEVVHCSLHFVVNEEDHSLEQLQLELEMKFALWNGHSDQVTIALSQWYSIWIYCCYTLTELTGLCDVHLINEGLTIDGQTVTVQVQGTGPSADTRITEFNCQFDSGEFAPCKS